MPGTSGVLSPFSDMEGLYFDNSDEPDDFSFQLSKDLERIFKEKNIHYIKLDFEDKDDFYDMLVKMEKFNNDNITVSGTSREGHYEIVIDADDDLDDKDDSSTKEDASDNDDVTE